MAIGSFCNPLDKYPKIFDERSGGTERTVTPASVSPTVSSKDTKRDRHVGARTHACRVAPAGLRTT
ncbi:hypothetical protein K0M31_007330, partial [Melipona bicolor]